MVKNVHKNSVPTFQVAHHTWTENVIAPMGAKNRETIKAINIKILMLVTKLIK